MSGPRCGAVVKDTVRKIVDRVVEDIGDEKLPESAGLDEDSFATSDAVRRSGRSRKQTEFLVPTITVREKGVPKGKKKKDEDTIIEFEMAPAPSGLRGILRAPQSFPPPRKSSLSASTAKTIRKKYRKVRVKRRLQFKVIPPLPGWRADRTRMPEDDPDEDEIKRLEEQATAEAAAAAKKKRKRKSIGALLPVSDEDSTTIEELISPRDADAPPDSPDLFYEDFMRVSSPDSVLASDSEQEGGGEEKEEGEEGTGKKLPRPPSRFVFDAEAGGDSPAPKRGKEKDTVAGGGGEGTVESTVEEKEKQPVKKERRRSVRIQPEPKKEVEKKSTRRRSQMFPVTPAKDSPKVDRKAEAKRKQELFFNLDRDSRPTVEGVEERVRQRSVDRVNAWLSGPDQAGCSSSSTAAAAASGDGGEEGGANAAAAAGEAVEVPRIADSVELQGSEKSNESVIVEQDRAASAAAAAQRRKGRRSTRFVQQPEKEVGDKENKQESSKSKSKSEDSKEKTQFYSMFAPKPAKVTVSPKEDTVSKESIVSKESTVGTVPQEKKTRRRSMVAPKKPAAPAKKKVEKEKKEEEKIEKEKEEGEREEEDEIEIVEEVKGEEKKEEKEKAPAARPTPAASAAAAVPSGIWRPVEFDAAPFSGLVHVGEEREEEKEEEEEEGESVSKMRRVEGVGQKPISFAIPSSLRREEKERSAVAVFESERKESLSSRAAGWSQRAREIAAAAARPTPAATPWPESIRPKSVAECVGAGEEFLQTGVRWLSRWKRRLDQARAEEESGGKAPKAKKRKRRGGGYSDEEEGEDSDSDYEMREEEQRIPNPMVLTGPVGCGKTAYIHALSEDLGFSLLESSPEEERTGRALRAKLAGAVANHRMSASKPSGGIAMFMRKAEPKKEEEGEGGGKRRREGRHTMVVIEHIDVIFTDKDALFWPALAEILTTAKIPIVLIGNRVPDELTRILRQVEESGVESLEVCMGRGGRSEMEEYVGASITGSIGRSLSTTVIPSIVARARSDLRASLYDAQWAAAGERMGELDLADTLYRRADEEGERAWTDRGGVMAVVWREEGERKEEMRRAGGMSRYAEYPMRGSMTAEEWGRLCAEMEMESTSGSDAVREREEQAVRMVERARSGVGAGGRSGLVTRREMAMDWMPILEQIDEREQEKKRERRRHQHYFNVVNTVTGVSIDPLDQLQGACAYFRLPRKKSIIENHEDLFDNSD